MRNHDLLASLLADLDHLGERRPADLHAIRGSRPGDLESLIDLAQTLEHALRPVPAPSFTDRLYRQLVDTRADDLIIAFPERPWRLYALGGLVALLTLIVLALWAVRRFRGRPIRGRLKGEQA